MKNFDGDIHVRRVVEQVSTQTIIEQSFTTSSNLQVIDLLYVKAHNLYIL